MKIKFSYILDQDEIFSIRKEIKPNTPRSIDRAVLVNDINTMARILRSMGNYIYDTDPEYYSAKWVDKIIDAMNDASVNDEKCMFNIFLSLFYDTEKKGNVIVSYYKNANAGHSCIVTKYKVNDEVGGYPGGRDFNMLYRIEKRVHSSCTHLGDVTVIRNEIVYYNMTRYSMDDNVKRTKATFNIIYTPIMNYPIGTDITFGQITEDTFSGNINSLDHLEKEIENVFRHIGMDDMRGICYSNIDLLMKRNNFIVVDIDMSAFPIAFVGACTNMIYRLTISAVGDKTNTRMLLAQAAMANSVYFTYYTYLDDIRSAIKRCGAEQVKEKETEEVK